METKEFTKHLKDERWYLDNLMDLGGKQAMQFGPFGRKDGPVTVICYGEREEWKSRWAARQFFQLGTLMCDGSERNRYMNIFLDLTVGKKICSDGEPERGRKTQ